MALTEGLLLAAKAGDSLARHHVGRWMALEIVRFYRRQGYNETYTRQQTRDCAQNAIKDLLKKLDQAPTDPDAYRDWTMSFAQVEIQELWTSDKRQRRKHDAFADAPVPDVHGPETQLAWYRAVQQLRAEVEKLRTPYRDVYKLICEHESAKKVAEILDIPAGTVRRRYLVARRQLRDAFEDSRLTAAEYRTPASS